MQILYHQDTEESIYKIHIMDQSNELNHLSNSNGQNSPLVASILFFLVKKCRLSLPGRKDLWAPWKNVLRVALSPLGLTFSPTITILLMNRFLLLYGNEQSVAVYGCIGYITSIIYLLPPFFKLVSVWLAVPLAQAATFVSSVIAARITAIREAWIS